MSIATCSSARRRGPAGEVVAEAPVGDVHAAVAGVDRPVARHARRRDAVEGVNAVLDRDEDVVGLADPSRCLGLSAGSSLVHPPDDRPEVLLLQRPADPGSRRSPSRRRRHRAPHLGEVAGGLAPQILVLRAWITPTATAAGGGCARAKPVVLGQAADRPQAGALQRVLLVRPVFISVVSSSNAKMMSAPSWCWICIDSSGVNRCVDPSRWDLKVTPSSSTAARRSLPSAIFPSSGECPRTSRSPS